MMGRRQRREPKLFYVGVDLDERVPAEHPLRAIEAAIDFSFVREAVADRYGRVGYPSIDPIVLLKLMFLLFFENVRSERELARQLPMRLDWLWFCGFDLDSQLPNHSVLSKARRRWGVELFEAFFAQVLDQCVQAGLVDGGVAHADGSLIEADASAGSVQPQLYLRGRQLYQQLDAAEGEADIAAPAADAHDATPPAAAADAGEDASDASPEAKPEAKPESESEAESGEPVPTGTRVCRTDPDAQFTRKYKQTTLGYKDHRVVDDRFGIITATITTDAATAEADRLLQLLDTHEQLTGATLQTIVADKGYGTAENYQALRDRGVTPCIPHKKPTEAADGKFRRADFIYEPATDTYRCPAGQPLHRRGDASDGRHRYRAGPGVCAACELRSQCTDSRQGRLLSRHVQQDAIEWADQALPRPQRQRLMRRRKAIGEGSFADATHRHGYKRMRWRGRTRATIQNLLIGVAQNLRKLLRHRHRPHPTPLRAAADSLSSLRTTPSPNPA